MKHLVLGSSGQIGCYLVNFLNNNNQEVQVFDIAANQEEDLRKFKNEKLTNKIKNSDFVHFLAFDVGGSKYLNKYQHTKQFLDNNVMLMKNTFEALEFYKKPFIFSSSQMSNMNYSSYGVLKRLGEFYTKSLDGLIVKYWNVYGVETDETKAHVITDFIKKAMTTKHIEMMTDGEEERQFLYAEDCCRCNKILADNYDALDKTKEYHLTSFEWSKIIDIAEIISKEFGGVRISKGQIKDPVQNNKRNEPDPFIKRYWQPEVKLKEGIQKIIKRMREINNENSK